MYENISKTNRSIGLLLISILFSGGFILWLNYVLRIISHIEYKKPIIIYDLDLIIPISFIFISIICVIGIISLFSKISEKSKSKVQNYSLLITLMLLIVTPIPIHQHVTATFSEAGYVRCGYFHRQKQEEGVRSLFRKSAWVLDVRDCAQADAYPPGRQR